jgi:hypothetical protein
MVEFVSVNRFSKKAIASRFRKCFLIPAGRAAGHVHRRTSSGIALRYLPLIEQHSSLEGTMTSLKKIITGSTLAALLAGTMAASPAAAWWDGGYGYGYHNNGAAIAGAAIGGMALGAMIGAAASQPHYCQAPVYDRRGNIRGYQQVQC